MNRSRAIVLGLAATAVAGAAALWLARPELAPESARVDSAAPAPEPERAATPLAPPVLALPAEPAAAPAADAPVLATPEAQGETRTAVAIEPLAGTAIVGRLLDDAGGVLARKQIVSVRVTQGKGRAERQVARCQTDEQGLFRVPIPDAYVAGSARMLALRMPVPQTVLDASPTAVIDLSRALPPGETDVGDVQLGQGPPLVSGQVVDASGAPVAGAQIALEVFTPHGRNKQEGEWVDVGGARAQSDAAGRFVIVDLATSGALAVRNAKGLLARASKDGLTPSQRTPVVVRTDVRLVLRASGLVEGSLIAARDVPLGDLTLRLIPVELEGGPFPADSPGANPREIHSTREGAFRFGELAPGRWRFEVCVRKADPLVVIDDVWVRAGEVTRDPDMQNMPLDRWIRAVRIEVVDPEGHALPGAVVKLRPPGASAAGRANSPQIAPGVFLAVIGGVPRDLEVHCAGFRTQVVTGVDSDRRVVLAGGQRIRVVALGGGELERGDVRLGVMLRYGPQPGGGTAPVVHGSASGVLGPDGSVVLRVTQPGRWTVFWGAFTIRRDGSADLTRMAERQAGRVDLGAGEEEARIELVPDLSLLDPPKDDSTSRTVRFGKQ